MPTNRKSRELDFSSFPPGTVTEYSTLVCLACIFDIFTVQLGLAPRTASSEIKRYSPSVAELTAPEAIRPFFDSEEKSPRCPYCNASKKWHARLDTFCIEGGKATDAARRSLIKSLPRKDDAVLVIETKFEKGKVFFDWLATLNQQLDFAENTWLIDTTRALLERQEPKIDWSEMFAGILTVRRSNRLASGWQRDGSRLFLAPNTYDEALLVQYLVSRSHTRGGRTFAGRLTLLDLIRRLRRSGYLDAADITERDQFVILEKLVEKLAGGPGTTKLYHIVDRRDFLEQVKVVYSEYAT